MPKFRYLLLVEATKPPRQGLARFYKFIGRRFGIRVVDHKELPEDAPKILAQLLRAESGLVKARSGRE